MPHTIEEGENAEGWGFVIKDDGGATKIRVWHAHAEQKTTELQSNARKIAEEEVRKLDNPNA